MPPIHTQMTRTEWMFLFALSLLWGGSFFFQGVAVQSLPPLTIVWLRVAFAGVAMWGVLWVTRRAFPVTRQTLFPFLGLGCIGLVMPFSLLVWAQTHITSSLASILNALTPFCIMGVAHFLTRDEKITSPKLMGLGVSFIGVVLIIGPEALSGLTDNVLAQLACVGACMCYGFASVYGRRFAAFDLHPVQIATGQFIGASVLLLPAMVVIDTPWRLPVPGAATWAAILALAVLSTSLAYLIYFRLLATVGATNIGLVTFLVPVSAISLGILVLGDVLAFRHILGGLIIAAGLTVIDGRLIHRVQVYLKRLYQGRVS